ncbi:MAG: EAL domain-containing protein [Motilibacteraceae bacterium]
MHESTLPPSVASPEQIETEQAQQSEPTETTETTEPSEWTAAVRQAVPAAYGPLAARLLARAAPLVDAQVDEFIDRFYGSLSEDRELAEVLSRLTRPEFAHLVERQREHLRGLLDPQAERAQVLERGRQVGRVHSLVGVELDWYAHAVGEYQEAVVGALQAAGHDELTDVRTVVGRRLLDDLTGALRGYRDVHAEQSELVVEIARVVSGAETVRDLAQGVLDALVTLPGIRGCLFGRPDETGRFLFELGAGEGAAGFLISSGPVNPASAAAAAGSGQPAAGEDASPPPMTTGEQAVTGLGPAGRAWRSSHIERSDSYLTDPSTAPWHGIGRRYGLRSSAAVPLSDPEGRPRALLALYAAHPGYFSSAARASFLVQLRQVVEQALVRLETSPVVASAVTSFADRTSHQRRLHAGEVVMHYQPVVDLASGRLVKLEALARLGAPGHVVPPAAFLPALGEDDLLLLFRLGLDQALPALRRWDASGLRTGVSLNLPPTALSDERYLHAVSDGLARHRLEPHRLTLELLENGTVDVEGPRRTRILRGLAALGVHLAEDDLGAGHSSLLRLRTMPFDEVKVDQQLVRGAEGDPRDALSFVQPITSLAHSRGIRVVVEGLESAGLIEAAAYLGADAGQGYGISRPMPEDAVLLWAQRFRLDVDHTLPQTRLGALAAHLAWETRLATFPARHPLRRHAVEDGCLLTAHLAQVRDGREHPLRLAHQRLHAAAVHSPGSPGHLRAWTELSTALMAGSDLVGQAAGA